MLTEKELESLVGKYLIQESGKVPYPHPEPKKIIGIDGVVDDLGYMIICPNNYSYSLDYVNDYCEIITKETNPEYFL